jgi:hypothetical protein
MDFMRPGGLIGQLAQELGILRHTAVLRRKPLGT